VSTEVPESLLDRLSYLLGSLYRRSLELEGEELAHLGIGVKQQAMLTLLADEGPMTQQRLGLRLGIDRTTIVAVVDELQDAGLIERARDPADRRAYLITLTPSGQATQRQGRDRVDRARRALLAGLDEDEQRTLTGLLGRAVRSGARPGD
jgi:DNA-binding MarR family transcriptional regulator